MRIHRPIAQQVVAALTQTFGGGFHADKVIERLFRFNKQLGARDRKFIAESTYEIVRWWRLLWAGMGQEASLADRDLWRLLGVWLIWKNGDSTALPTWPEMSGLNPREVTNRLTEAKSTPAIAESVPDWMYNLGATEFGAARWREILSALNRVAPVVLRANRLKTTRELLLKRLNDEGIDASVAASTADGLVLTQRRNLFTSSAFKDGWFELQDGASQQVAPMVAPEPGLRVIDACAGAGGKSLHLAALMRNKGKIIAMDIYGNKLDELKRRAARAGCDIIETRVIESSKTIKRLKESADRVLLDVPCSGLGVLRRNPDAKWKLKEDEIVRLRGLQAEILEDYAQMTKPGGRLVYATCSVLPSENEQQVAAFLSRHPDKWKLVEEHKFMPGDDGYDGFYAAALQRIN